MINKIVVEGKTKEEAIENLKINTDEIIILNEEEKSALFKGKKVTLEVIKKEDIKNYIREVIDSIKKYSNLEINVEIKEEDNCYNVNLISDNNALLIGKEGKNLEAFQTYLRNLIKEKTNNMCKLNLDISDYKKKKINTLEREIKKIAKEVKNTKIDVKLDPMNSYERMIIHNLIDKYDKLYTESIGEEPNRYVVIKYKEN